MAANALLSRIARPSANLVAIAAQFARRTDSLPTLFAGLRADKPRIKYGCLKVLRRLGETRPGVLYPEFNRLVELLGSENTILKWGGIIILGNLASVDADGKLDAMLDRYLRPIRGPVMITAANTIRGAGKIALAKPHLADRIARELIRVEAANYQTPECRNVALGHAVESLGLCFAHVRNQKRVLAFVERQLHNTRNAVRKRAATFIKKHGAR